MGSCECDPTPFIDRPEHSIHGRIDRFYTNRDQKIKDIAIFPNNLSVHDSLKLILETKKTKPLSKGYALVIARFRVQYGQYFPSFSYFADLFHKPLGE